jgi:hypothetical protein
MAALLRKNAHLGSRWNLLLALSHQVMACLLGARAYVLTSRVHAGPADADTPAVRPVPAAVTLCVCTQCDMGFKSPRALAIHAGKLHLDKALVCPVCDCRIACSADKDLRRSKQALEKHVAAHVSPRTTPGWLSCKAVGCPGRSGLWTFSSKKEYKGHCSLYAKYHSCAIICAGCHAEFAESREFVVHAAGCPAFKAAYPSLCPRPVMECAPAAQPSSRGTGVTPPTHVHPAAQQDGKRCFAVPAMHDFHSSGPWDCAQEVHARHASTGCRVPKAGPRFLPAHNPLKR